MKKFTLIISMLSIVCANAFAQSYVIHKTDGTTVEYQASETDYIEFKEVGKAPNEAKAVDLGLSVKWANMNVGANSPEEYGDFFAWGETEPKTVYSENTYKFYKSKTITDSDGFETKVSGCTKYICKGDNYGYEGFYDDKYTLDSEDDAAYCNWGGKWRMPTYDECKELIDNCSWEYATLKGVKGCKITAKNGNWIFLPDAGDKSYTSHLGNSSLFWCSELSTHGSPIYVCTYTSDGSNYLLLSEYLRYAGKTIRAVSK